MEDRSLILEAKLDEYARVLFTNEAITMKTLINPFNKESILDTERREVAIEFF